MTQMTADGESLTNGSGDQLTHLDMTVGTEEAFLLSSRQGRSLLAKRQEVADAFCDAYQTGICYSLAPATNKRQCEERMKTGKKSQYKKACDYTFPANKKSSKAAKKENKKCKQLRKAQKKSCKKQVEGKGIGTTDTWTSNDCMRTFEQKAGSCWDNSSTSSAPLQSCNVPTVAKCRTAYGNDPEVPTPYTDCDRQCPYTTYEGLNFVIPRYKYFSAGYSYDPAAGEGNEWARNACFSFCAGKCNDDTRCRTYSVHATADAGGQHATCRCYLHEHWICNAGSNCAGTVPYKQCDTNSKEYTCILSAVCRPEQGWYDNVAC